MLVTFPLRGLAALGVLLALALAALAVAAPPAQARDCTVSGSERVCIAKLKESCSPGPPYRCRVARDECRYSGGRLVKCEYSARRRTCRSFGGQNCSLDYKTFCTTDTANKRCRTDSRTTCRRGRCLRTVDSCRTSRTSSSFSCSYTKVEERCNESVCRITRTTCRSSSSRQGKRCFATFGEGPGSGGETPDESFEEELGGEEPVDGTTIPEGDPEAAPPPAAG